MKGKCDHQTLKFNNDDTEEKKTNSLDLLSDIYVDMDDFVHKTWVFRYQLIW